MCVQYSACVSVLLLHLRCGSKQAEEDYRPLFENFVQDLLSTVNKPEWPASELLLSLLGRLLVRTSLSQSHYLQRSINFPVCAKHENTCIFMNPWSLRWSSRRFVIT